MVKDQILLHHWTSQVGTETDLVSLVPIKEQEDKAFQILNLVDLTLEVAYLTNVVAYLNEETLVE